MKEFKAIRTFSLKFWIMTLVTLMVIPVVFIAAPVNAEVPGSVTEVNETDLLPIYIFVDGGELNKFTIGDNDLRGYKSGNRPIEMTVDGQSIPDDLLSLDEVITYRLLQLAFTVLWPDEVPDVADFTIVYKHPGREQKASLEYITRAFSRGDAHIELEAGITEERLDLEAYQYTITNKETEESFITQVLGGVFPESFFGLRTKVMTGMATEAGQIEFTDQWQEARSKFLSLELDELFEVEEEELTPPPYWSIIFTLGLTAVVVFAAGYSLLGRKK